MNTTGMRTGWAERRLQRLPPAYAREAARHIARVLDAIERRQRAGLPPPPELGDLLTAQEPPCPPQHDRTA